MTSASPASSTTVSIHSAGAYSTSYASTFNGFSIPESRIETGPLEPALGRSAGGG